MIKAVFFDIDGTLFSYSIQGIPPSAIKALKLLKEKNILCIIATGRHPKEVRLLPLHQMNMDGYVLLNGQICADQNFVPFFGTPFSGPALKAVLQIFQEKRIPVMLYSSERFYLNTFTDEVQETYNYMQRPLPKIDGYQGEDIYQLTVYASNKQAEFWGNQIPDCKLLHWNSFVTDIIPSEGGKMKGIRKMLEHIHCSPDEIMAFGDGQNDADMLEFAGIGVAMGNGHPEAKKHADFITKDIDDDGIFYALKHFNII